MYFILRAATENVAMQPGCLDAIMDVSGGDMRKAVTYLQTCHQLSGGNAISLDDVTDISGKVSSEARPLKTSNNINPCFYYLN